MARSDSARLASLALMTLAAIAGCRGVLGIDDAPAGPGDADGAAATGDGGPEGTEPDGAEGDGDANAASDGATADGAIADGAARDGGFDGAVREVDLAYPAYPLPADSPPVANYSVDRGAVFDHTTGLEWEQTIAGAASTWQQASDRCATLTLAGKTDWRMPSRSDLISLLDLKATAGPTVNRVVFPDGASEALWSSSIYASNDAQAWTVFFSTRTVIWQGRSSSMLRTRCVRGTVEAATKPAHWAVSTLEAMDLQTGLVWQRAPGPTLVTFSGALVYCQGLEINGKRGFRVPSQRELISITDESATSGGVDTRVFSTGTTFLLDDDGEPHERRRADGRRRGLRRLDLPLASRRSRRGALRALKREALTARRRACRRPRAGGSRVWACAPGSTRGSSEAPCPRRGRARAASARLARAPSGWARRGATPR